MSKNHAVTRRIHCVPPFRSSLPHAIKFLILIAIAIAIVVLLLATGLKRSSEKDDRSSDDDYYYHSGEEDRGGPVALTDGRAPKGAFPPVEEFELGPLTRRFDNEDARVVGFPVREEIATEEGVAKKGAVLIYLATPYFGEWNPKHYYFPHLGQTTFRRYACPVDDCHVTKDPSQAARADAVLFHVRDLDVFSLPSGRSPNQVWILYSMEPPWLEIRDMRRFEGVFNWTMSYRRDSDLVVRYGFVGRKPKSRIQAVPRRVPERKQNRALWLVSNCNTDSNREGFVERLRRVYPVDVRGGCGSADGCRPAETKKCYRQMALGYKFYLSFENAICADYVTEKLFNALEYFMIPVTFGGGDYASLAPPHSMIDALQFQSPEELGRYLWEVSKNDSLFLSYFQWKRDYRSYLQPWMCDLCETLHRRPVQPQTRQNLERWWYGEKACLRWTGEGLEEVQTHPFPKYHSRLF